MASEQLSIEDKTEFIYRTLRERICLGDYPPGRILSENKLAQEFGVSRTPIRAVLQTLESEGMVVSRRGFGTIVSSVELTSLKEVYALRMKLAELIGQLPPVAHPTDEHIATLEALLEEVRSLCQGGNPRELARLNIAMHEARQPLIGNRPLRKIFDALYYQTARVWLQVLQELEWAEEVDCMCDELVETIRALRAGDMLGVGLIRRNYISLSLTRIINYLNEAGGLTSNLSSQERR